MRLVEAGTQMAEVDSNDPGKQLGKGKSVEGLVNKAFAAGLFSVSEIAFDREYRRALVGYSFVCGMLCGSGGVLRFEKVNGESKKAGLNCGGWVS
jgi:hypothetical protein